MRNPIPKQHRFLLTLLVWGLSAGAGIQLGTSLMSQVAPRVQIIEVIEVRGAPEATHQSFEF